MNDDDSSVTKWSHPGGKLRELGAESLTDSELLAIIISTGIQGKTAVQIATEVLEFYGSIKDLCNQPLENMLRFKGLSDVKIIRIAAVFELSKRIQKEK